MNTSKSTPNTAPKVRRINNQETIVLATSNMATTNVVHVMVGVIKNADDHIFIALRPDTAEHLAGYWEFPGGKKEPNETPTDALARELNEELGITVTHAQPFTFIEHAYPEKRVILDVYTVTGYKGEPHGAEGQKTRWVPVSELNELRFPEANAEIVELLIG